MAEKKDIPLLAFNLRYLRISKGVKRAEVAKHVTKLCGEKVTDKYIYCYEKGLYMPDTEKLQGLACFYGISSSDLMNKRQAPTEINYKDLGRVQIKSNDKVIADWIKDLEAAAERQAKADAKVIEILKYHPENHFINEVPATVGKVIYDFGACIIQPPKSPLYGLTYPAEMYKKK